MLRKSFSVQAFFSNYYQTLKVEQTATQEEIKQSFINLAKKHHPDMGKM